MRKKHTKMSIMTRLPLSVLGKKILCLESEVTAKAKGALSQLGIYMNMTFLSSVSACLLMT